MSVHQVSTDHVDEFLLCLLVPRKIDRRTRRGYIENRSTGVLLRGRRFVIRVQNPFFFPYCFVFPVLFLSTSGRRRQGKLLVERVFGVCHWRQRESGRTCYSILMGSEVDSDTSTSTNQSVKQCNLFQPRENHLFLSSYLKPGCRSLKTLVIKWFI